MNINEIILTMVEILRLKASYLKAMDEKRKRDWLNKVNSRPRKKRK